MPNSANSRLKQAEARALIEGGMSRRALDRYLISKYGSSIGHQTHSKLFQERVRDITTNQREQAAQRGFSRPKNARQERYNALLKRGFLSAEARMFSRIKKNFNNSHALRHMADQRAGLWKTFAKTAVRMGWTSKEISVEWRKTVIEWYKRMRLVTGLPGPKNPRGKPVQQRLPSPWGWYTSVNDSLPPDQQDSGSPRLHKRKTQRRVTVSKITKSHRINSLLAEKAKATDPKTRAWLDGLIAKARAGK